MTTALHTVGPDHGLAQAARIMEDERVRQLMVVDPHHRLLGVVSYRALVKLVAAHRTGELDEGAMVSDFMEPEPVAVEPATSLRDAIGMMLEHRVSSLPVVDHGRLVGIVSEHDVMRTTATLLDPTPDGEPGT